MKLLWSDNGTQYVKACKDIQSSIKEWNKNHIDDWCKARSIQWKFNPPAAPHFGGIWEREVRSIKKVLNSVLSESCNKLTMTDEILTTLMCEIEEILNNRPLTAATNDVDDMEPLTPNHLLRLNSEATFPGVSSFDDSYPRRRWRQVQHLANIFWTRWRHEYVPLLNQRQKWSEPQPSHKVGDLILVVDQNLPRNFWCTGRITDVFEDSEGLVRSARVKVAKYRSGKDFQIGSTFLHRPIHKLVLLRDAKDL